MGSLQSFQWWFSWCLISPQIHGLARLAPAQEGIPQCQHDCPSVTCMKKAFSNPEIGKEVSRNSVCVLVFLSLIVWAFSSFDFYSASILSVLLMSISPWAFTFLQFPSLPPFLSHLHEFPHPCKQCSDSFLLVCFHSQLLVLAPFSPFFLSSLELATDENQSLKSVFSCSIYGVETLVLMVKTWVCPHFNKTYIPDILMGRAFGQVKYTMIPQVYVLGVSSFAWYQTIKLFLFHYPSTPLEWS